MPTAYGYIRVSTSTQANSELGLMAQSRMIRDYISLRLRPLKIRSGKIYADPAVSAFRCSLPSRPAGAKMMAHLRPGDHVVIAKMDRAFRSVIDFARTLSTWHDMGVHVHLLDLGVDTTCSGGRLVASIMASIAEWESRRIGERIKEALEERRAQGRATHGYPPIGYAQQNKRWDPCPKERRIARQILAMRKKKGMMWKDIANRMNFLGIKNRGVGPWKNDSVANWAASAAAGFPRRGLHNN